MTGNHKVFAFVKGAPKLIAFASSPYDAAVELRSHGFDCDSQNVYFATIKGNGPYCYVREQDDAARLAWNLPIITPQVPTNS